MHHIFIEKQNINIIEKTVVVHKDDSNDNFNHLVNALRVKKGEDVMVSVIPFSFSFDYRCKVIDIDKDSVILSIVENTKSRELPMHINLYQGISKSDKFEFIVEKAVELGVYSIVPLQMDFCIARFDEKKEKSKIERLNKIARSAAEQSKRNIIPEVKNHIEFMEMLKTFDDRNSTNILFYENAEGISLTKTTINECKNHINDKDYEINVIIGPEGGFSDKEINETKKHNVKFLTLGDRILRTETAAITALSILMYELQN